MPVPLITVKCQNCGHQQNEPAGAISTSCIKCQSYIAVDRAEQVKTLDSPKRTRVIVCPNCERSQKVYPEALTIMCLECGTHLNIANHTIKGKVRHNLTTFGEVTFLPGTQYTGVEVCAQVIQASGDLQTRLKAYRELIFNEKASVSGPITSERILVQAGARVEARRMKAAEIEILGYLRVDSIVATGKLVVKSGGYLAAKTIKAGEIEVVEGGGVEGDFESIITTG